MASTILSHPLTIPHRRFPPFVLPKAPRRRIVVASASEPSKSHLSAFPAPFNPHFDVKFESLRTLCCNVVDSARKPLALLLFCVAVGFVAVPGARIQAVAATAAVASRDEVRSQKGAAFKDHEFSGYTRRLLDDVSGLLRRIEAVKASKEDMGGVRKALLEVKEKKKEIQAEVLAKLNAELRELRKEKVQLVERSGEVMDSALVARKELDELLMNKKAGDEAKEDVERLERILSEAEKEYSGLWEKVGEIDDRMLRRETITFSIAIRELSFIERECELLVQRVERQLIEDRYTRYRLIIIL